jgi:uncharacterized protein YcfJ
MMNKSTVTGIIIGVIIASAGGVIANYSLSRHDDTQKSVEVAEGTQLEMLATGVDVGTDTGIFADSNTTAAENVAVVEPEPAKPAKEQWALQEPTYAEVLSVTPVSEAKSTPREVCQQVPVTEQAPVKDENRLLGTITGAVIGGVLGHQVGGGSGKKVATVAGAAAGGYAGNKVQENMQNKNTTTRMETRCETVYDSSDVVKGYDVVFNLNGREGTVRMDYDPGTRIPVENGQLMIRK